MRLLSKQNIRISLEKNRITESSKVTGKKAHIGYAVDSIVKTNS